MNTSYWDTSARQSLAAAVLLLSLHALAILNSRQFYIGDLAGAMKNRTYGPKQFYTPAH